MTNEKGIRCIAEYREGFDVLAKNSVKAVVGRIKSRKE